LTCNTDTSLFHHRVRTCEAARVVTDNGGHCQTLSPVGEIYLEAHEQLILTLGLWKGSESFVVEGKCTYVTFSTSKS